MPAAAVDTERTMPVTLRSKSLAMLSIAARRSAAARAWVSRLGLFQPANAQRVVLEDLHGRRHRADLVAAPDAGNVAVQRAVGQRLHAGAELAERPADAAADHPGDAAGDDRDAENGEAQQPHDRLQLGVEIVEIGAGAEIHVEAGDVDGVADLADRLLLPGLTYS